MINITKIRKKFGLSQEDFSKILGISRPTFSDIEQGKRPLKEKEKIKLADALEISVDDLDENTPKFQVIPDRENPYYKFKQVLLYLVFKCAGKPNVGKTVLNKLLYFCDFDYYERHGESITGVRYIKKMRGPVPEVIDQVLTSMIDRQEIKEIEVPYYEFKQKRIIPLIEPDLSVLNAVELDQINEIIGKYGDKSAEWISNRSHGDLPWRAIEKDGEVIPYGLVMYRDEVYSVSNRDDDD